MSARKKLSSALLSSLAAFALGFVLLPSLSAAYAGYNFSITYLRSGMICTVYFNIYDEYVPKPGTEAGVRDRPGQRWVGAEVEMGPNHCFAVVEDSPDGLGPPPGGEDVGGIGPSFAERLKTCAEMNHMGKPDGCTSAVANSGTHVPALWPPRHFTDLTTTVAPSTLVDSRWYAARQRLGACYANFSIDPEICEERFYLDAQRLYDGISLSPEAWELFQTSLWIFRQQVDSAYTWRNVAEFFQWSQVEFSWRGIGMSESVIQQFLRSDTMNSAMIQARLQLQCKLWIGTFEAYGCAELISGQG